MSAVKEDNPLDKCGSGSDFREKFGSVFKKLKKRGFRTYINNFFPNYGGPSISGSITLKNIDNI